MTFTLILNIFETKINALKWYNRKAFYYYFIIPVYAIYTNCVFDSLVFKVGETNTTFDILTLLDLNFIILC